MDKKVRAIKNYLFKGMPGRSIEYQYSGSHELHKFRIVGKKPTHWFYISREVVDDSEPVVLINLINIYHVIDTFNAAKESKWLFLESNGIREVDENFTK